MGYMSVIEKTGTWTCPYTGSYKIICVAGGQGGSSTASAGGTGGSTSFGSYLTASGNWGGTAYQSVGSSNVCSGGRNGYTLLDYGIIDNTHTLYSDFGASIIHKSIGYGAGGYGRNAGGCGKLQMCVINLNEGDTINCIVGAGGNGSQCAGNAGVIVVQYLGIDSYIDEDTGDNENPDDGTQTPENPGTGTDTPDDGTYDYTIKIYNKGNLYKTIGCNTNEQITLPTIGDGFSISETSASIAYVNGATVSPTADMTLYAVHTYTVALYNKGSKYTSLTKTTTSATATFTLPSVGLGFSTSSSSNTITYKNGDSITTSGTTLYVVNKFTLNLYKYGALYDTLTVNSASSSASFTLSTCTPDEDEVFYGWTTTSGSTTKKYDYNAIYTSTNLDSSLYAIFSYNTVSSTSVSSSGSFTIGLDCDMTIRGGAVEVAQASDSQQPTVSHSDVHLGSDSPIRISINGNYIGNTINNNNDTIVSVKKSDIINLYIRDSYTTSSGNVTYNNSFHCTITYMGISGTAYRSTK